jgi:IclR family KDG regulon transcriptional repressor
MNLSLQKTSKILDILMQCKKPVGVNEFSETLQMPKSTISRFLSTLESLGFVRRDSETGKFFLGLKLFELGCKAMEDLGLREVAIPKMESLRDLLNENVLLTILEGTHITYLDKIESQQVVVIQTNLGGTAPAYCVSGGKAMVAHFSERIEIIISEGLEKFTANTITDPKNFRQECQNIREQGYAINNGEFQIDVHGVGTPIFNARGEVVGAISTAVPASRMSKELLEDHIKAVTKTGNDVSSLLGFSGLAQTI